MAVFKQIQWLVIQDFRDNYPSVLSFLGQLIGIGLSLSIYWYTAIAFVPNGTDYFEFIVVGQLALFVPMTLLAQLCIAVQKAMDDGTFEIYLTMPGSPQLHFVSLGLSMIPREFCWMLVYLFSALGFGLQLSLSSIGLGIFVQILALPAFAGLGLLASSFVIYLGRGSGAASTLSSLLTVFSGAFFPLTVLPGGIQKGIEFLNPLVPLVDVQRLILNSSSSMESLDSHLGSILFAGAIYGMAGWQACNMALAIRRSRGSGILL